MIKHENLIKRIKQIQYKMGNVIKFRNKACWTPYSLGSVGQPKVNQTMLIEPFDVVTCNYLLKPSNFNSP